MAQILPFTRAEFLDVFAVYNSATWPLQLAATAIAAAAGLVILFRKGDGARWAWALLGLLWIWTGAVYHFGHFAAINPMALAFGVAFLLQGALLIVLALARPLTSPRAPRAPAGWTMIVYALVLYPLLVLLSGHAYPAAPLFIVTPCPLVIFTFGVLALSGERAPWILFVVPGLWAIVGGSAAALLGMSLDYALPIAAIAATAINAGKRRLHSPA